MRILVVDDERSFALLLRRALKRLGHQAEVACEPRAALDRFREQPFDGVITDIEMPEMNGVELALALRAERPDVPIAFCRGIAGDRVTLEAAKAIGGLLPKVWTVADVKRVVEGMAATQHPSRRFLAQGSQSRPPLEDHLHAAPPTDSESAARSAVPRRLPKLRTNPTRARLERRLSIRCKSWEQVTRICDEQGRGGRPFVIRGKYELSAGDRIGVALGLPDELVLAVNADVLSARTDSAGLPVFQLSLEISSRTCSRLHAMACAALRPRHDPYTPVDEQSSTSTAESDRN